MLQRVVATGLNLIPDSLHFDEPRNTVWAAERNGGICTVRLLDGRVQRSGFGYRRPEAVLPGHDGLTVTVVERGGRVWRARRDYASRNQAELVADVPGRVLAARRHPDPARILVLTTDGLPGEAGPSLVACDLTDGTLATFAAGLTGARSFVVDDGRREVAVLAGTPDGSRSVAFLDLDTGALDAETACPEALRWLSSAPNVGQAAVLGTFDDATGDARLVLQRADGTQDGTTPLGRPVTGLTRWGSLVLASTGTELIAVEWDLEPGPTALEVPLGPLYVNGYATLDVDLAGGGLALADVAFTVTEGPDAGLVSAGIEPPNADGTQPIRLVAGMHPGEYHLEVTRVSDGDLLARRRFRVTRSWPHREIGPPVSVTGEHQTMRLMSWGGTGASGDYVKPAPEEWRVLVVLISLADRRWGNLANGAKTQWKDFTAGGGTSVRTYYEEVSYRNTAGPANRPGMTVKLVGDQVFGPVDMPEGWGDVFFQRKPGDANGGWKGSETGKDLIAGAISTFMADQPNGAQLMALADSIAIVVRSGSDTPTPMGTAPPVPTRFVWGHASTVDFWRKTPTTFTQGPKKVTFMTDLYPAGLANPPSLVGTLVHEIGHNLGLADLYDALNRYPAEINARSPARVDLMASSKPLPHLSLGNRIRLGWIDRAWLRRFDFSANPTGGDVTLQATETLSRNGPPAGRVAGIEVPISNGWSYLFEYRRRQAGQVGDQSLGETAIGGRFVLGTDLRPSGGESARPPILLVPEDADDDGPVLDRNNTDYRDSDVTNPQRMHDFTMALTQLESPVDDAARVEVTYVGANRPQLQVRPAPGNGDFKSPDILLFGPFGEAIPGVRKGMPNRIEVRVHNRGTLKATDVKVHVKWLPFTVSAGAWNPLPSPAPFTVPAGGTALFGVAWDVPKSVKVGNKEAEHFCVRVDIERYRDPAHPEAAEIVVHDNWAQSNFDAAPVPFGSPSTRVSTVATATNPFDRAATYLFTADQSTPWYRVYVGHAWLRLPAGGTRAMELAYESLAGDPLAGDEFERQLERITSVTHHAALTSWLVPEDTECETPEEWWGASLDLRAGRRTWIEDLRRNGEIVTARVFAMFDGDRERVGGGDVYLAVWPENSPEQVRALEGSIGPDGVARVGLDGETLFQFESGTRMIASMARAASGGYAQAVTEPELLE